MKTFIEPSKQTWPDILKRPVFDVSDLFGRVQLILDDIRKESDQAIRKYTERFDGVWINEFSVLETEIAEADKLLDEDLKIAISTAAKNIELFHLKQKQTYEKTETMPGVTCWQKAVPIERIGLYIPGGSAPLFSTVLMLAIPAQIAGCKEIVLCSPPDRNGKLHPAILHAAKLSGVTGIYKIGGVQAIGAMAFGTQSIPKTFKIFGPGNQYVMAAKQLVSLTDVAVDMPAGPSEVLIVANHSSNPSFVASDLLSQAEHGPDSQVILLTSDENFAEKVKSEIENQLKVLSRSSIAEKALENSVCIILKDFDDQINLINEYAPEHLIISVSDFEKYQEKIVNAGSVFLGEYTPESAGDYASGTNHTLPTNGWARSFSGVNLDSFIKKITFQHISKEGLHIIGPVIEKMATAEVLDAHKNAVSIRLKNI